MGPILLGNLVDILAGRRLGGSGGSTAKNPSKVGASGRGRARVWVGYDNQLPALSLQDREKFRTLLARTILANLYSHVICKNWHLRGVC